MLHESEHFGKKKKIDTKIDMQMDMQRVPEMDSQTHRLADRYMSRLVHLIGSN